MGPQSVYSCVSCNLYHIIGHRVAVFADDLGQVGGADGEKFREKRAENFAECAAEIGKLNQKSAATIHDNQGSKVGSSHKLDHIAVNRI
jgi:hypothetical protein